MGSSADVQINFGIADYCVFISLLVVSSLIGVFWAWRDRKEKNNQEFLTGGRNLQVFPVAMSLSASFMSTNTILGGPAEVYSLGTSYMWHLGGFTVAVILAAKIFMPIYYQMQLTSVHKYLLRRFKSNAVRLAGSVGFILCTLPYMGVVLFGPSLALSSVTPLSIPHSILIVGLCCTFYTSIGGIKAVIWTDVVQAGLMILGLVIVIGKGSYDAGGILEPFRKASEGNRLVLFEMDFNPHRADTFWACFLGMSIAWTGTYCVKQTQVQRYCCLPTKKHAARTLYANIPGVYLIGLLAVWCGIIIYAKYGHCDPITLNLVERTDQLMPFYVMDTMSHIPGLPGLFVACVFSGALSTLSSGYNALATVTWDDFLKHAFTKSSSRTIVWFTKLLACSYGLLSIGIAFMVGRLGTVFQGSIALSGSVTGPLLAMFCLGIFVPYVNAKGAFTGLVCGIGFCLFMTFGVIANPRPKVSLPLDIDQCPPEREYLAMSFAKNRTVKMLPWEYSPTGLIGLYHVSYMYISLIGFCVAIVIGLLASLITGGERAADAALVSPLSRRLCSSCVAGAGNDDVDDPETVSQKRRHSYELARERLGSKTDSVIMKEPKKLLISQV